MGALLYQWSTVAQLVTVLMIALFYTTLARSVRRSEVVWWQASWWWNFVALAATVAFWFFTFPPTGTSLIRGAYVGCKTASVLLLVQGALAMRQPGARWLSTRELTGVSLATALVGMLFLATVGRVGIAVQGPMGVLFLLCGVNLLRGRVELTRWLGVGFLLRGSFALVEAAAYLADSLPAGTLTAEQARLIQLFLGSHSAIDVVGEWLLALGGVLAITRRTQNEMESANADLRTVQDQLRNLADRDPLTSLANRRALAVAFRSVYDEGAALVFLDLDAFKIINDTMGHAVGDACLRRFADALRHSFRPEDVIVRYAGDEFVVVCAGADVGTAEARVDSMRDRLLQDPELPTIQFSAGVVALASHADADAALEAADSAMYENKKARAMDRASRPNIARARLSGTFTAMP
jgi:diguanylate cyclase (GGDEF)-like protein